MPPLCIPVQIPVQLYCIDEPWTDESPEAFFTDVEELARERLDNAGQVPPGVLFAAPQPGAKPLSEGYAIGVIAFGSLMDGDLGNNVISVLVPKILDHAEAVACVFVSEAWVVLEPLGDRTPEQVSEDVHKYGRLKNHPNRIEVLMLNRETRQGGVRHCHYPIERDAEGKPSLGEMLPESDQLSGRFASFLRPSGPKN